MMNGNYNGQHMNPYGLAYQNQLTQLMGLQNYGIQQQQIQQGRNPPAGYPGYPGPHHGGVPGGKNIIFILKLSTLFWMQELFPHVKLLGNMNLSSCSSKLDLSWVRKHIKN